MKVGSDAHFPIFLRSFCGNWPDISGILGRIRPVRGHRCSGSPASGLCRGADPVSLLFPRDRRAMSFAFAALLGDGTDMAGAVACHEMGHWVDPFSQRRQAKQGKRGCGKTGFGVWLGSNLTNCDSHEIAWDCKHGRSWRNFARLEKKFASSGGGLFRPFRTVRITIQPLRPCRRMQK